jgi:hypothetical protein
MPAWISSTDLNSHRHIDGKGFDTDAVDATMEAVELRIERFHGHAWTPRTTVEDRRSDGTYAVRLSRLPCRQLVSVSVDGEQQDVSGWRVWESGRLERYPLTPGGRPIPRGSRVRVEYEHGDDEPPQELLDAAIRAVAQLVAHHMNPRVGERTETIETPDGHVINFAGLPDWGRGRPFGMPDVDMVVNSFAEGVPPAIA